MATAGFLGELAESSQRNREREKEDDLQSQVALRERKADEIELAIKGIQQRGALKPGDAGYLSPEDLKRELDAAQQQLTGLYQSHEGPDLMKRLKGIFGKKHSQQPMSEQPPAAGVTSSTGITLRPGMTLSDVLAAGAPTPPVKTNPYVERKQQLIEAGFTEEQASKAIEIMAGVEPKAGPDKGKWELVPGTVDGKPVVLQRNVQNGEFRTLGGQQVDEGTLDKFVASPAKKGATKGLKYDKTTGQVVDQDTGKRYSRGEKSNPPEVTEMFKQEQGAEDKAESKEIRKEDRLEAQRAGRQLRTIRAAFDRGDYNLARRELNKAKADLEGAETRQQTMHANYDDALKTGNQQAMLSLVANHIGMTLGAQKGARITRAAWDEAMDSAPWMSAKVAQFFHQDEHGDHIFDGWKTGVTLTKEQMDQMVQLADEKVGVLKMNITNVEHDYGDDLNKAANYEGTKKTEKTSPKPAGDTPQYPKTVKFKGKDIPVDANGTFIVDGKKFKLNPDGKTATSVP